MAGEGTGHPPSYAEVKKMKLLAIYTHGCLQGYLKGLLFLSLINCLNCQFYVWPGTNMKGILSRRKWGHWPRLCMWLWFCIRFLQFVGIG